MIFRSRFPDVRVPDISLTDYVLEHVAAFRDHPALIDGPTGRRITYAELEVLTRRVAAGLTSRGFKRGDALCIFSPNVPEYAPMFFGVSLLGGVNTTANPMYGAEELARQLRDSGARIVVTVPQLAERALKAAELAGGAEVIVFGEAAGCTPFAALVTSGDAVPAVAVDPANDVVALPYSSGTTGLPKGVMLTHRNLVANLVQIEFIDTSGPGDHTIGILPFFHIYGMVVILCAILRRGATVVTMPQFDLETYLRLTQDYKVASAYLVPPVALALAKHPLVDKYDLSSLKMVNSGAAPMSGELEKELATRLDLFAKQGYGMTETSPVTHFTPNDGVLYKPGSCGLLVPNTECRIKDIETGRELGPNERGELYMRGPQVMKGYLNHAEATAASIDAEGWLRTGDVAYADEDGFFYIVDRLKEFIKYKGYQVAPAELEAVLLSHPKVADAAVIPMADDEAGEVPKAFVVMREPVTPQEIMEFVAATVAPYKKVRAVEFVEKIPKSASGKILRRELIAYERGKAKA
ncbi:MAG: 4-coumarate--CoA ligase family protein [Gemmatimonadetes bacterium]|nr:4-coumarate--CoA ligase family protein [Gemmatimonadota bacterium]MBI3568684.1 4-coumarate--CoA ligase family protein [Gemmatimonadota bacterium]